MSGAQTIDSGPITSTDNKVKPTNDASLPVAEHEARKAEEEARDEEDEEGEIEDSQPPLPSEEPPPLPDEPAPEDDGWEPMWDNDRQAWYFYNHYSRAMQWENPRVPEASSIPAISSEAATASSSSARQGTGVAGGYNPAIHGDYDPNADYAQNVQEDEDTAMPVATNAEELYAVTGAFNRFTNKFQRGDLNPDNHTDSAKSGRQMSAYFDVTAAANIHDGRSLKDERRNQKISKSQLNAYKVKKKAKKEEKKRAWLKD